MTAALLGARALPAVTRDAVAGRTVSPEAARDAVAELLDEATEPVDVAAFLTAVAVGGATPVLVAAAVRAVLAVARPVAWTGPAADVVGTGGDGSDSVNISTLAGLVAASAGATVAKAGNRAATSRCGSADLLEALGVDLDAGERIPAQLAEHRFAFLFAPALHPALRRIAPVRRRLGFRTLFNLSGPLANPVPLTGRLIGTATRRDQEVLAEAAALLGHRRTWVVLGADGMDELTTAGPARVIEVDGGDLTEFTVDPAELPLLPAGRAELAGGGPERNAALARQVLAGTAPRPLLDTVLLNAAAVLLLAGVAPDLATAVGIARDAVHAQAPAALTDRLAGQATPAPGPHPAPGTTRAQAPATPAVLADRLARRRTGGAEPAATGSAGRAQGPARPRAPQRGDTPEPAAPAEHLARWGGSAAEPAAAGSAGRARAAGATVGRVRGEAPAPRTTSGAAGARPVRTDSNPEGRHGHASR
ncbi:anthranilate phosphoribosyltransferase [Streptomyces sp. bgisy159]|uniref:anthranilate phosphoribosyltransferase n=1 Tax=Streptomyces sp. bgisy159 TaxID=3413795 RepID=UPI003F49D843